MARHQEYRDRQANSLPAQPQYPTTHNRDEWPAHWQKCGQPWRTEPEIDSSRQKDLAIGSVSLAGVHWNSVDLSVVDWAQLKMLGEEREAQQPRGRQGEEKDHAKHISEYRLAARSNRQLALVLQE